MIWAQPWRLGGAVGCEAWQRVLSGARPLPGKQLGAPDQLEG